MDNYISQVKKQIDEKHAVIVIDNSDITKPCSPMIAQISSELHILFYVPERPFHLDAPVRPQKDPLVGKNPFQIMPESGCEAYLLRRTISVKEPESVSEGSERWEWSR